VHKLHRSN